MYFPFDQQNVIKKICYTIYIPVLQYIKTYHKLKYYHDYGFYYEQSNAFKQKASELAFSQQSLLPKLMEYD
jgi:hypothetical protein